MSNTTMDSPSVNWICAFPHLAAINDATWRTAQEHAKVFAFPPGTTLMRPGEPLQGFLLLAQGRVRVSERAENGREIVLYRVSAGELCILNLAKLFNHTVMSVEAVSEEPVLVVNIPTRHFENAFAHCEAFHQIILSTLSKRLTDLLSLVGRLTFQHLDLRLACVLRQLFRKNGTTTLSVTHQELADELGTTREVMSRLLKEFERLGYIRLCRGSIELISRQGLDNLSGETTA